MVKKLIIINPSAVIDYNTNLIINGKKVIKNTLYLFNDQKENYIQIYYNGDEYISYREVDEINYNESLKYRDRTQKLLKELI